MREQIAQATMSGLWKTERQPEPVMLGTCEALHFQPATSASRGVLLALHGGGFRQGAPETGSAFNEELVNRCAVSVFSLRYRLAPEFPFPAGLSDAWTALGVLRRQHPGLPLVVCGDSAGGGLAAGLGLLSAASENPPVDGVVLLSPWLDLTVQTATYEANASSDPLFSRAAAEAAARLYLQGEDARHPLASPLQADLQGYPPTLITVGSGEVLLDDSVQFAAKLRAHGVATKLEIIDGMDHVAVTRNLLLPGAAACFEHVAGFIAQVVGRAAEGAKE